jgi:hypothetical protein
MRISGCSIPCVVAALAVGSALADVVEIGASRDNTLYEDPAGNTSNGSGSHLFAGRTLVPDRRRALIHFDVAAAVPAGATIDGVSLTLVVNKTIAPAHAVSLHRAEADWGEGASDASGEEGIGDVAAPGDATWLHAFFPGTLWAGAGGDFAAVASATTSVNAVGPYTWSAAGMVADVQDWLERPGTNFGWAIVGDEFTFPTAKRFASSENAVTATRPKLTIEFTPGSGSDGGVPATSPAGTIVAAALLLLSGALAYRRRATRP